MISNQSLAFFATNWSTLNTTYLDCLKTVSWHAIKVLKGNQNSPTRQLLKSGDSIILGFNILLQISSFEAGDQITFK
jgi:hypothetical protein